MLIIYATLCIDVTKNASILEWQHLKVGVANMSFDVRQSVNNGRPSVYEVFLGTKNNKMLSLRERKFLVTEYIVFIVKKVQTIRR